MAWEGVLRCSLLCMSCYSVIWSDMVWYGVVWYGATLWWCGIVDYDMVWYGMVQYGMWYV